jgi:hypothetical protein
LAKKVSSGLENVDTDTLIIGTESCTKCPQNDHHCTSKPHSNSCSSVSTYTITYNVPSNSSVPTISTTFDVPKNAFNVLLTAYGGGGGSGINGRGGGGGAGGGMVNYPIPVKCSDKIYINVGKGGSNGSAGENSYITINTSLIQFGAGGGGAGGNFITNTTDGGGGGGGTVNSSGAPITGFNSIGDIGGAGGIGSPNGGNGGNSHPPPIDGQFVIYNGFFIGGAGGGGQPPMSTNHGKGGGNTILGYTSGPISASGGGGGAGYTLNGLGIGAGSYSVNIGDTPGQDGAIFITYSVCNKC